MLSVTITWSNIVRLTDLTTLQEFEYPGVYLHFLKGGRRPRIVNVGTSNNVRRRQVGDYSAGFLSKGNRNWNTFDLNRIQGDIYEVMSNGVLDSSVKAAIVLMAEAPAYPVESEYLDKTRKLMADATYVSAAKFEPVIIEGTTIEKERIESIIQKYLIHTYDLDPYRDTKGIPRSMLGKIQKQDMSEVAVRNVFPMEDFNWFDDLPTIIPDRKATMS